MTVVAGVDIGNATTEVALLAGGRLLGTDRLPTRGRKGSAESVHGAAALVRRIERRLGATVTEASIAPLRAVDTARWPSRPCPGHRPAAGAGRRAWPPRAARAPASASRFALDSMCRPGRRDTARVVLVPPGLGYVAAAAQLRD